MDLSNFMDGGAPAPNKDFRELYRKPDHAANMEMSKEYIDLYNMLTMGVRHPEQKMDLLEIFKRLKGQQMDAELNSGQVRRFIGQNNIRNQELKYLPQGTWDIAPQYNFTGRRM